MNLHRRHVSAGHRTSLSLLWTAWILLQHSHVAECWISGPPLAAVVKNGPSFGSIRRGPHWASSGGADDDDDDAMENQALEAIQSLADFHEGQWQGSARSFTVSADTAAGILHRSTSPPYTASVKLGMDLTNRDYTLTETFEWKDDDENKSGEVSAARSPSKVSARTVSLTQSNTDVDTVDASYSLDMTLPTLPSALLGTDQLPQFLIEHCIALNDDERAKCWVLYGGADQGLMRIVLCHETRCTSSTDDQQPPQQQSDSQDNGLTAADLLEMQTDVDRLVDSIAGSLEANQPKKQQQQQEGQITPERIRALEESFSKSGSNTGEGSSSTVPPLSRHATSLLEATSGVWLGDLVVRDKPTVPLVPQSGRRGFGKNDNKDNGGTKTRTVTAGREGFAKWSIGVQKAAWRWMWNFGEEIRQVTEYGRGMGATLALASVASSSSAEGAPQQLSLSGTVCVNEGLSRRMPIPERIVYIDWNAPGASASNSVAFLVDSFLVHAPRFLQFASSSSAAENTRRSSSQTPFLTEFGVFQQSTIVNAQDSEDTSVSSLPLAGSLTDDELLQELDTMDGPALPELVCSKVARIYNFEGSLKQGCSSFYTLKRFGSEM